MEQTGTVYWADENTAKIKIHRSSACGENCAACGLCGKRDMTVCIKNTAGFEVGDEVRLTSDDSGFVKRVAAGYLTLTALLILGAAIGFVCSGNEIISFFCAFAALGAGVLVMRKLFKKDIDIKTEKIER